tara:strand:- start:833 stop:2017 length:1185 start_codon:yes stop_codon:yes gene_type:complete
MKSKLSILIDLSDERSVLFISDSIIHLAKILGEINLINVSEIIKKKKKIDPLSINKDLIVHHPNNISELKDILVKKKFTLMYCITLSREYFFINFLINRLKNKIFIISNLGYNPENFNYEERTFFQKIKIFFNIRFNYYIMRILVLFNILPNIDYFFESSSYVINSINGGLSKKIQKKISWLNFSLYKNLIKINSKHHDNLFNNRFEVSEEYIVFVDGFIFDHKDRIMRDGKINIVDRKKYFKDVNNLLSNLQTMYEKKIIVCLHPANNIALKNKDYGNFECVKYQTEKFISKAFIVLYHEGSSVIQAILEKKNIINLHGNYLGTYINKRCELYAKLLDIKRYDLENYKLDDKESLIQDLNASKPNYEKYIRENIITDSTKTGIEQIIYHLNLE